jgi:hypothetical protein
LPSASGEGCSRLNAHVGGDLPDGEHRAQTALGSEPTRAATGVDELGVKAAAVGALVAVLVVLCAAVPVHKTLVSHSEEVVLVHLAA